MLPKQDEETQELIPRRMDRPAGPGAKHPKRLLNLALPAIGWEEGNQHSAHCGQRSAVSRPHPAVGSRLGGFAALNELVEVSRQLVSKRHEFGPCARKVEYRLALS